MYQKTRRMRRAPLMFNGPTPVNMAPAMAGYIAVADDAPTNIQMPPDYVGKESSLSDVLGNAFKSLFGSGAVSVPVATVPTASSPPIMVPRPRANGLPVIPLVGIGLVAYFLLRKR